MRGLEALVGVFAYEGGPAPGPRSPAPARRTGTLPAGGGAPTLGHCRLPFSKSATVRVAGREGVAPLVACRACRCWVGPDPCLNGFGGGGGRVVAGAGDCGRRTSTCRGAGDGRRGDGPRGPVPVGAGIVSVLSESAGMLHCPPSRCTLDPSQEPWVEAKEARPATCTRGRCPRSASPDWHLEGPGTQMTPVPRASCCAPDSDVPGSTELLADRSLDPW
mmetsp:Transcript_81439/g.186330  ORF Transcript_81439/g.186330 Transcript_81439/m.186330 type:complete len:219 (+) Transcript_81439:195-851(+)